MQHVIGSTLLHLMPKLGLCGEYHYRSALTKPCECLLITRHLCCVNCGCIRAAFLTCRTAQELLQVLPARQLTQPLPTSQSLCGTHCWQQRALSLAPCHRCKMQCINLEALPCHVPTHDRSLGHLAWLLS